MAQSGLNGEAAPVWKMWQVERDDGVSTRGAAGSSSSGDGAVSAAAAADDAGDATPPNTVTSASTSTAASVGSEPYLNPCDPPLGMEFAPAWLHGADTKQKPAAALVQALSLGAFLVRLKKKGKGVIYAMAINVGAAKPDKCLHMDVGVDKNGFIALDAKCGQLSGRLEAKHAELRTVAELVEYLSNTPFDIDGRGWKIGLSTGVERDGTPIPSGWREKSDAAVGEEGGGDGGDGGGGGGALSSARSSTSLEDLHNLVQKGPVVTTKTAATILPRLARKPRAFKVVCDAPCCDLPSGLGLVGDRWQCTRTAARTPRVRFADGKGGEKEEDGGPPVAKDIRDKSAYSVEFTALHDYTRSANGFLRFKRGTSIYVWNESGSSGADLGVLDGEGVYWMHGYIDESHHGFFPADHVTVGKDCDAFMDSKLG